LQIVEGDLNDARVVGLLHTHVNRARAETGRDSAHALDAPGLQAPDIRFWTIWDQDRILGLGALKILSRDLGEIKSMHTAEEARRKGVGSAMLDHILAKARSMGLSHLSLETGSWDYFLPARAFYRRHGFGECAAFSDHRPDPNSVFMTRALTLNAEAARVEIRPYAEKDFEAATIIWLASWQSTGVAAPISLEELRLRWAKEAHSRTIHVAMLRGEIVAFATFQPGMLDQLFVAPAHQSKGIGKALLDFAKQQMPEGFELHTALKSRAAAFYDREGLQRGETAIHPQLGHEIIKYHWRP
jgi:putative acetyltransferase